MVTNESKPIVKRDASGRTMTQRFEKIESAVRNGNAAYKSTKTEQVGTARETGGNNKAK